MDSQRIAGFALLVALAFLLRYVGKLLWRHVLKPLWDKSLDL